MPQATLTLLEQVSTLLPSAGNTFAVAGVCSSGLASQSYSFDADASPSVVLSSLGHGPLTEAVVTLLRYGRRRVIAFPVTPTVAGAIGSVTEEESMPNVTLSAITASAPILVNGPYDSLHMAVKVTGAGAEGVARFQYCLDDQIKDGEHVGTWSGDIIVPAAQEAELVGTIDLSTITSWGNGGTLDTLTFIITSDTGGPSTCTFVDPADLDDAIDQINTAWSGEATVELVGASKLRILSVTAGATGTLLLGNGTANSALGFTTGASATGSAATYDIPGTGVRTTWASGTYPLGGLSYWSTVMPKIAAGVIDDLFTRVHEKIATGEAIGALWIVQEDADAIDGRTMINEFSTQLTASRAAKFYLWGLYQLHRSTSDDDEIIEYVGDFIDPYLAVSVGDFRSFGGILTGGRFHRPASWVAARKAARDRYSSDLGNRTDRALNTLFGVTEIGRDERTATTKLATFRSSQTQNGGGFLALETPSNAVGEAYFYRGRTMAQAGSVLGDLNSTRVLLVSARQVQRSLDLQINTDPPVRADGTLVDAKSIKREIEEPLQTVLFDDPEAPQGHASSLVVSVPEYDPDTHTLSVEYSIQRNAQIKAVVSNLGIVEVQETVEES